MDEQKTNINSQTSEKTSDSNLEANPKTPPSENETTIGSSTKPLAAQDNTTTKSSTETHPSENDTTTEPSTETNMASAIESLLNETSATEKATEGITEPTPTETPEPSTNHPQSKFKKPLLAILAILILGGIGTGAWFLINSTPSNDTAIQYDVETTTPTTTEPIEANKLALQDNSLSDFDLAFLRLENKQENIIYSPLSIKYALAMLADAANGQSKEQITSLIGDYRPQAYLNSANRSLANAMFIRTDFSTQVKPTYTDTLKTKYNADVILDPFTSPDNANQWVEDKTLGIIKDTFDETNINTKVAFLLVNALAIDMNWNYRIQCATSDTPTDIIQNKEEYSVKYTHENYNEFISCIIDTNAFPTTTFNDHENTYAAKIGTSANRYDIINELGESHIRDTVRSEYIKYHQDQIKQYQDKINSEKASDSDKSYYQTIITESQTALNNTEAYLDQYISDLSSNFGNLTNSTDFYFLDTDSEKVFAKDLQEYDGSTLQYVSIMPKSDALNTYLDNLTSEKAATLISQLKDSSDFNSFTDGVVTKITGSIPFFKFNFTMNNFTDHLQNLGITDVFDTKKADLSGMLESDQSSATKPYIDQSIHKADIDFSNDGIKAAAVTAFGGKGAAGEDFDYKWNVPIEEIDLTFDKPFLFLIRDKSTGEIWFTGTVYEGNLK